MTSQHLESFFPDLLTAGYQVSSAATQRYNCIAWAAGDDSRWWEPHELYHWPEGLPQTDDVTTLVMAYEQLGYETCTDGDLEEPFEKIAIYGSGGVYQHAARQLPDGRWTSKIGAFEDIEHETLAALEGSVYGLVVQFLRRKRNG